MIDWKVYEKELEESIKQTWSHLIDLSNGVKKLGGGGCRSQVVKMRRMGKNDKKKKEKEGGGNSSPGDQGGAETPQSLAELSFFSRWLF